MVFDYIQKENKKTFQAVAGSQGRYLTLKQRIYDDEKGNIAQKTGPLKSRQSVYYWKREIIPYKNTKSSCYSTYVIMNLQNSDLTSGFISLINSQIGDKEVRHICTLHTYLVRHLFLNQNHISHVGIKRLSSAKWEKLKGLYIGSNKIGNKGCKYLSKGPFSHVKQLALNDNKLGSAGMMHLSKVQWTNLKQLLLSDNPLSGAIIQLVRTKQDRLSQVSLYNSSLTLADMFYLLLLIPKGPKGMQVGLINNLADCEERSKMKSCMEQKMLQGNVEIQYQQ